MRRSKTSRAAERRKSASSSTGISLKSAATDDIKIKVDINDIVACAVVSKSLRQCIHLLFFSLNTLSLCL